MLRRYRHILACERVHLDRQLGAERAVTEGLQGSIDQRLEVLLVLNEEVARLPGKVRKCAQ